MLAHLATAALLLVTLGASFVVFVSLRPDRGDERSASGPTDGLLFEVTLPPTDLPPADPGRGQNPLLAVDQTTWAPGTTYADAGEGHGTNVRCVAAGAAAARVDAPGAQLVRAGGADGSATGEPVRPGLEVALAADDCLVIPADAPSQIRADESEGLVLLETRLVLASDPRPGSAGGPVATRTLAEVVTVDWAGLASSGLALRLERRTLAAGESLPPPGAAARAAMAPEEPFALGGEEEGTMTNRLDRPVRVLLLTAKPVDLPGPPPDGTAVPG